MNDVIWCFELLGSGIIKHHILHMKKIILLFSLLALINIAEAQTSKSPKGNLFIIGGGDRPDSLMQALLQTAQLTPKDYIVVLPMSSEEPDTSFYYFHEQIKTLCKNTIANLNFTKDNATDKKWLDSLRKAKLIFITGGDQSRFMQVVLHTPIYEAIHQAYENGATISGSSAGAAVMSEFMITGNQLRGDTTYHATFDRLWDHNIEFSEGLGLLHSIIIDQHFIVRSRYNRLLSAIYEKRGYTGIGIDESTAIIYHNHQITVRGLRQVLVFKDMENARVVNGLIKFSNIHLAIYTSGDRFKTE